MYEVVLLGICKQFVIRAIVEQKLVVLLQLEFAILDCMHKQSSFAVDLDRAAQAIILGFGAGCVDVACLTHNALSASSASYSSGEAYLVAEAHAVHDR